MLGTITLCIDVNMTVTSKNIYNTKTEKTELHIKIYQNSFKSPKQKITVL